MTDSMPLNVLVPLAGHGKRFAAAGYVAPKPMVRAKGIPMILRCISALEATKSDNLLLVYHRSLEAYNFRDLIGREFPDLQIRFVPLFFDTRGPAETVLLGLTALTEAELTRPTLIADGDSIFTDNVLEPMRRSPSNLIFYFEDREANPIYSYLSLGDDQSVKDIKEKIKISDNACIGAYGFESGDLLLSYCKETVGRERADGNELYISNVYRTMIDNGCKIKAHKVDRWDCLGTPVQLRHWAEQSGATGQPQRICFDLDNTLVTYPTVVGDYNSCLPIERNIRFLRFLKQEGHHIIIHSARRMRTHAGDASAAIDDIGELTKRQLERFNIPYDEIIFGKPYADMYVDDLAVLPQTGLEQQTGFYMDSGLEPRSWNSIEMREKTVLKSGPAEEIKGEISWYKNLPGELSGIAPKLVRFDEGSLEVERVLGIPMSQLHVSGALTSGDLTALLTTLDRLHAHPIGSKVDIYANYADKIRTRSRNLDHGHLPGYLAVQEQLLDWLQDYAVRDQGRQGLIHGDPVFTNVIVTPTHEIKLIDPRGQVGDVFTLAGDIFYDYAKVYQSLLGYDSILQDVPQPDNRTLIDHFHRHVMDAHGEQALDNITMIAASHLFSLIPLHQKFLHADFLNLAKSSIARTRGY